MPGDGGKREGHNLGSGRLARQRNAKSIIETVCNNTLLLEGPKCRRKRKLAVFKELNDTHRVKGRVCVRSQGKEGVVAGGSEKRLGKGTGFCHVCICT